MVRRDLFVELLEAFELGREAAFGGGVDDQDDFVLESGEGIGFAFFCEGRDVSKVGCIAEGRGRRCMGYVMWSGKVEGVCDVLSRGLKS